MSSKKKKISANKKDIPLAKKSKGNPIIEDNDDIKKRKREKSEVKSKIINKKYKKEKEDEIEHIDQDTLIFQPHAPKYALSLRFKTLATGTLVLCAIREIRDLELVVSLPNNLLGFIKITDISDIITDVLSKPESVENVVTDLSQLFYIGQIVRCVVKNIEREQKSKRIELSMLPSLLNKGITIDNLADGSILFGCIKSIEDHGYLIYFGLPKLSGFLLKKILMKMKNIQ